LSQFGDQVFIMLVKFTYMDHGDVSNKYKSTALIDIKYVVSL